jgi:hypothetical protein
VKVHTKSCLIPEPLLTLRPEDKGQAGACPDHARAIPCKVLVASARDVHRMILATWRVVTLKDQVEMGVGAEQRMLLKTITAADAG